MKRLRIALATLLLGACARAAEPMLTHAWRAEATRPAEVAVTLRQGETLRLECTLLERAKPITPPNDASARFFWRDADAKGAYWTAPATLQGNVLSFDWSPARDAGKRRYDFFLSVESPTAGTLYRASGVLILQPSPGFNPADLEAPDVFAEVVDRVSAEVKDWADATYQPKGDYLTAEADPTVSAWAKAAQKPTYAWAEIQGRPTSWAWEAITGKPAAFPPAAHTHDGSYLKLTGGTMTGTILSALSKASDPGLTITLGQGDRYYAKHTQAGIQARRALSDPEEFYAFFSVSGTNQIARLGDLEPLATKAALAAKADKTHTHPIAQVTALQATLDKKATKDDLASKADKTHTHTQAQVTGLTAALSQKANATHTHVAADITNLSATLNPLYAAKSHAHPIAEVTGLQAELNGKSPVGHGHAMIDVEGLTDALGGYLPLTGGTVNGEVRFNGNVRFNSWTSLFGTPVFDLTDSKGMNFLGLYTLCGYTGGGQRGKEFFKQESPTNSWIDVTTLKENGTPIANKYAAKSHTHTAAQITEADPTVPAWAKAAAKPTYTASEVGAAPTAHTHADLAPLSSVSVTTNAVTYVWIWDDAEGTFALAPTE